MLPIVGVHFSHHNRLLVFFFFNGANKSSMAAPCRPSIELLEPEDGIFDLIFIFDIATSGIRYQQGVGFPASPSKPLKISRGFQGLIEVCGDGVFIAKGIKLRFYSDSGDFIFKGIHLDIREVCTLDFQLGSAEERIGTMAVAYYSVPYILILKSTCKGGFLLIVYFLDTLNDLFDELHGGNTGDKLALSEAGHFCISFFLGALIVDTDYVAHIGILLSAHSYKGAWRRTVMYTTAYNAAYSREPAYKPFINFIGGSRNN